jgi:hypothetical protein
MGPRRKITSLVRMPTIAKFKPKVSSKLHAQSTIYVKPKKVD